MPPLTLSGKSKPPHPQSQSPLFHLPSELRSLIWREAFGDRAIHLCLDGQRNQLSFWEQLNLRFFDLPWRQLTGRTIPGIRLSRDRNHFGRWVVTRPCWHVCFCHAGLAIPAGKSETSFWYSTLFTDGCGKGSWGECERHLGVGDSVIPVGARLGVTGALLCCRRAYHEVIHILFATNALILDKEDDYPYLLKQQFLATQPNANRLIDANLQLVTTLHINSSLIIWPSGIYTPGARTKSALDQFTAMVELIPQVFPNTRRLQYRPYRGISLSGGRGFQANQREEMEDLLFRGLMRMGSQMRKLEQFVVAMPNTQRWYSRELFESIERCRPGGGREFDGKQPGGFYVWYPFTVPAGVPGAEGGFWLVYDGDWSGAEWQMYYDRPKGSSHWPYRLAGDGGDAKESVCDRIPIYEPWTTLDPAAG